MIKSISHFMMRLFLIMASTMVTATHQPEVSVGAGAVLHFVTYHNFPPFIAHADRPEGLTQETVALLNQRLSRLNLPGLQWRVAPKKRAEAMLGTADTVAMLWVDPAFVGDPNRTRFQWTKPLLSDCQLLVSRESRPVAFAGDLVPLRGLRIGTVLGARFPHAELNARFADGSLLREDAPSMEINLNRLLFGRVDAILIPHSSIGFMAAEQGVTDQLHYPEQPLFFFERAIALAGNAPESLVQGLRQVVDALAADPEWQALLAKYGLQPSC